MTLKLSRKTFQNKLSKETFAVFIVKSAITWKKKLTNLLQDVKIEDQHRA